MAVSESYRYNVYYSQYPVIAVKTLPNNTILVVSSRHIQYFSKKQTEVFDIQLPPAYSLVQATVHSTYISALAQSPTHGIITILSLKGVAMCDSEARTLPIYYSAQNDIIFISQGNELFEYKLSHPSSTPVFTAFSKITAVAMGEFLNEECVFVGMRRRIDILQAGRKVAEMDFPGVCDKLVYNADLHQLVAVGQDKIISFYSLEINEVCLVAQKFIKIVPNQSCKYKISCIVPCATGYIIADTNGRIMNIAVRQYEINQGRRNKEFAAFCERLPFNIYVMGYEGSFSGDVKSLSVLGESIAACTDYVVLDTSIGNLDLVDEDVTISLGFAKESWDFYEKIRKTFEMKSVDEFFISAEQVDEDADIRSQLIMLERQFKSLIMDVYYIFKTFLLADKACPKPFFIMQGVNSEKSDRDTYLHLFFKKYSEEPLQDVETYPFSEFIRENYKTILFLFRSLEKRFRSGIDALRNLYNFLGPRLKDLKLQSVELRNFSTFEECEEWAAKSLQECQKYLRAQFDFEEDFVREFSEDNYSIQQLRYFKHKLQAIERSAVQVADARVRLRFSETLEALFNSFMGIIPEYCVTKGNGSVSLMLNEKRSQYDSVLGNYELVQDMVVHDMDLPEKYLVVPGSTNRRLFFVGQFNEIKEYNYKLFRSEARDLGNLKSELELDPNYRNLMSLVYMEHLYDAVEMHTNQPFLIFRTFTPLTNFDELKLVILAVNKESRGRFEILEPYQLVASPNNANYHQYELHRPRNTVRLSDLFLFFAQKYQAPHLSLVPNKKFVSPKCESFFKVNIFTEREIAIILKNLLDFAIFIQKQEKLTLAINPKKPKVHGYLTPQNIYLNLDSLEVHIPYFFDERVFEQRKVVNTELVDDICWDAPECVLTATHSNTDVFSIGMVVLAMCYSFIYLPRAFKASRDNIRPLSLMMANIGTFYTLTDDLHEENLQYLAMQKTKLNPFTAQKFVDDEGQLRLIIAILRSLASLSQDLRTIPSQEAANLITQGFLNSSDVQCAQFFLQNALYQPIVNANQEQTVIGRIFETNKETVSQLFSLLSKEMQRIVRSMLVFAPSARKTSEDLRKDPLFTAVHDAQKIKITKWQNAINMMKAAKLQREKKLKEQVTTWDNPVSYSRQQRSTDFRAAVISSLAEREEAYKDHLKTLLKQEITSFPELGIEEFPFEDYGLKTCDHEEFKADKPAITDSEESDIETFFDAEQLEQFAGEELSDDARFEGSGVPSENSDDSIVSIKYVKTEAEKMAEYRLYQSSEQKKEHQLLQKEAEEIEKQLAEAGEEKSAEADKPLNDDPIYAYEAEEEVEEAENVYYDEHGNAIYYDPTLVAEEAVQGVDDQQTQMDEYDELYQQGGQYAQTEEALEGQPIEQEEVENLRGGYDENGVYQYYDAAGNVVQAPESQQQGYQDPYQYGYEFDPTQNGGGFDAYGM